MKKTAILIILTLLMGTALEAVRPNRKGQKKLRLELYGAFATMNPSDLNQRAVYDADLIKYSRSSKHSFYRSLYDLNYNYNGDVDGQFGQVKSALAAGGRLKYSISPRFAVSLGFQYLVQDEVSNVDSNYAVSWINTTGVSQKPSYSDNLSYYDYLLSVRGYIPTVGIHLMTRGNRFMHLEAYLMGGPLFADCRHYSGRRLRVIHQDGYWRGYDQSLDMKGSGTGMSIEAGARLDFHLSEHVELFIEGGYALQRVTKITGSGRSLYRGRDSNADHNWEISEWEGQWVMYNGDRSYDWASFTGDYPLPLVGNRAMFADDVFNLDLSGLRVKVGLSYGF